MSMYAYWLANSGLTVHKLTGLMTEGIGAEELYALQETRMKKIRWIGHTADRARQMNLMFLQRLTQHFQRRFGKFREFIQKKHAMMCQ